MKKKIIIFISIIFILGIGAIFVDKQINKDKSSYTETNLTDKVEIGKLLFEDHLKNTFENFKNDEGKTVNILKDYKIIDAKLQDSESEDTFKIAIDYELQSIDGYSTVFITGNGVEYEDNWVRDKFNIIEVKKVGDNKYEIIGIYTG